MENLVVCIALYVLVIAVAHCPDRHKTIAAPVDYFPDVEEVTEAVPVNDTVLNAIATTKPAKTTKPNLSSLLREEFAKPAIAPSVLSPITFTATKPDHIQSFAVANDLSALGIREIYKLAKGKVKGYKSMTKSCLIEALST